jgi:aerobic C4-dicarboxylate transport protein
LFYFEAVSTVALGIGLLVGNGVATIVVSRWEGELDREKLNEAMARPVELGELLEAESA